MEKNAALKKCKDLRNDKKEISKTYCVKRVREKYNRKDGIITSKKANILSMKDEIQGLNKEIEQLSHKLPDENFIVDLQSQITHLSSLNVKLAEDVQRHKNELQTANKKMKDMNLYIDHLTCQLEEQLMYKEREVSTRKDNKTYNSAVRKTIYMCLDCNVPVDKAGSLIQFTALYMCGVSLRNLPGPTLTAEAAYELIVLSDNSGG